MNNKNCNRVVAEYLIENTPKDDIIMAVFEYLIISICVVSHNNRFDQ